MFCAKCGTPNPDDYKFCSNCGTPRIPPANVQAPNPVQDPIPVQPQNPEQFQRHDPSPYIPPQNPVQTPYGGQPQNPPPFQQSGGYPPPPGGIQPVKKKKTGLILALILLGLMLVITPIVILSSIDSMNKKTVFDNGGLVNGYNVGIASDGFRNNFTQIKGGGQDSVTVMIYVCGSNLESNDGAATNDIKEMLAADLSDNVNVILQTGGCSDWYADGLADGEVQRWKVEEGQLVELANLGQTPMLDPALLTDFINFSAQNFPANRYELIFWDHGCGSIGGYGMDEIYQDVYLTLPDIATALQNTDVKMDFVGFDACLMGSLETAYMLEPYADYLIASEESEPNNGWNYTPWLSALGENSSLDTVDLGQVVTDSYIEQNKNDGEIMLSVVALREVPKVYKELCDYMSNATEALADKEFKMLSAAVAHSKAYGDGDFEMIDLGDFVTRSDLDGKDELTASLSSAVKYSSSTSHKGVYGLSFYFPYKQLNLYDMAKDRFAAFGYGGAIFDFYDKFVNILAGGQKNSTTRSLNETLTGQQEAQTDYSGYDWYDNSTVDSYSYDNIDYSEMEVLWDDTNQYWYLPLTAEDWNLITGVEMQILLDDGEGYIDLGSDQYYEKDDAGNLILNYGNDNTWVAIGGQIVCYYAESTTQLDDGTTVFTGYVPAVLNDATNIDIILEWDGEDADGYIAGYRETDANADLNALGKGYLQFKPGDKVDFVCDYYTYDGDFDSSYLFGDPIVIGDTLPAVTYEDVGDGDVLECYMLIDIYQNNSWTETVRFGYDN